MTDFLNERREILWGFGGMLHPEISWVSESFRRDKALQIGRLFHLSISTWRVFLYQKYIIPGFMKTGLLKNVSLLH